MAAHENNSVFSNKRAFLSPECTGKELKVNKHSSLSKIKPKSSAKKVVSKIFLLEPFNKPSCLQMRFLWLVLGNNKHFQDVLHRMGDF